MDDLWFLAFFVAITLPTFLLSCWARVRRFAYLPLLILTLTLGGLLCYRYGELDRFRSLEPMKYGCGLAEALFPLALMAVGAWVLAIGSGLMIPRSTRTVGRRILSRVAPLYLLSCVLGYIVGRYVA